MQHKGDAGWHVSDASNGLPVLRPASDDGDRPRTMRSRSSATISEPALRRIESMPFKAPTFDE